MERFRHLLVLLLLAVGLCAQTGYSVTNIQGPPPVVEEELLQQQPSTPKTLQITNTSKTHRLKVIVYVWETRGDETEPSWHVKGGYPAYVNTNSSAGFGCGTNEKLTVQCEDNPGSCSGTYTVT